MAALPPIGWKFERPDDGRELEVATTLTANTRLNRLHEAEGDTTSGRIVASLDRKRLGQAVL